LLTIDRLTAYTPIPNADAEDQAHGQNPSPFVKDPLEFALDERPGSLSSSAASQSRSPSPARNSLASLTFTNGLALVISLQIGSGIFSVPSQVSAHVPSAGTGLLVWFLGGLLAWTGAASFIELGLRIPKNGGVQEYLRHCYGEFPGFIFVWISLVVTDPASMAMIAMIFSDYFAKSVCPEAWASSLFFEKVLALIGLALVTFVNCLGIRTGARVANGFLVLKLFAVSSIALLGLGFALRQEPKGPSANHHGWFGKDDHDEKQGAWAALGNYVTALFGVLFAYGGWDTVIMLCIENDLGSRLIVANLHTDWIRRGRYE
jgi:L-type amino acid transporter 6